MFYHVLRGGASVVPQILHNCRTLEPFTGVFGYVTVGLNTDF